MKNKFRYLSLTIALIPLVAVMAQTSVGSSATGTVLDGSVNEPTAKDMKREVHPAPSPTPDSLTDRATNSRRNLSRRRATPPTISPKSPARTDTDPQQNSYPTPDDAGTQAR